MSIFMKLAPVIVTLAACAPLEQKSLPPPEPQIQYKSYPVDRPVPCFTQDERPVHKPPTPIDIENGTVDQLSAALAADMENDRLFTRQVDDLFALCMKRIADGTATQPIGGKP